MRKFFNFRYSSSSNGSSGSSPTPPMAPKAPVSEKVYWEPPWESDVRDATLRPPKCYPEEDALKPQLRRTQSFSSAAVCSDSREGRSNRDLCGSPYTCSNSPLNDLSGHSQIPESFLRSKRGNHVEVQQLDAVDMLDSPRSPRGYQCSTANSPYSSPIPLRCRSARLTKILNKNNILDLYIDGEHQEMKDKKDSQKYSSVSRDCRVLPSIGKPPRAQSTAPSSPTYRRGNARTYSLREVKDISHHLSMQDSMQEWTRDDLWPIPPHESMLQSRDNDSEIAAIEDIYEDSSSAHPALNSNKGSLGFPRPSYFLEHGLMDAKSGSISSDPQESGTDEELDEKQKEIEQMLMLVSEEDLELKELENNNFIRNVAEDRKYLALELASQIKQRMAERSSAKERFKQAKLDFDVRTRRLEKEKNELQSSLEKELDRRSNSWSLKLEKFQSEEQRLRERVRELAEQNVSLQREISILKGREVENQSRVMNSEMELNTMMTSLKEVRSENKNLHHALSDLEQRFKGAEEEHECIRISYKQKEKETMELQKVVVRMQRVCHEQDKTINGLRQGYMNGGDNLTKLQMEQLRLTCVEQMLRKEIESFRNEMDSLRHENKCLLDRVQVTGNGYGLSSCKLDKELCARVDFLQAQGLSLLNDSVHFCGELLGLTKTKNDFDGYSIAECTVKYQTLRRRVDDHRRSVQTILTILDEKSTSEALECLPCTMEGDVSKQSRSHVAKDAVELELKAETLLTKLLREKLCSNKLELDLLESDLATSIRTHDVLQTETQRLKDEVSCLTHMTKDMELQILKKNDLANQLQHDLQECTKELTSTRSILTKVSEERDRMWEEVKNSREKIMSQDLKVSSLKKRVEVLEEDMLFKEGQIAILKDSLGDKSFDIICSPKLVDEFAADC